MDRLERCQELNEKRREELDKQRHHDCIESRNPRDFSCLQSSKYCKELFKSQEMKMLEDSKYEDFVGWKDFDHEDLWIHDKLILSTRLGYECGPRGMPVPKPDEYVVRPIMNLMGMGLGSQFVRIEDRSEGFVPDGFFWCEKFTGRHLSVDYEDGKQILCLEGIRRKKDPLWKWKEWRKIDKEVPMPEILKNLKGDYRYFNIEMIGDKVIEVHIRLNPNWRHGDYESAIPVFRGERIRPPVGYKYVEDKNILRQGFYFK